MALVTQKMEIQKRTRVPHLAIVILNYNGTNWLNKFLPSVISYSEEADIYVIDNASTDNSVSFLKENFPSVNIVVNSQNYGFAGGYNHGLKQIPATIYCLLNSDVEVTPHWTQAVLHLFNSDENIVAIQPKILDYKNKNKFEFAGAAGGFIDNLGYPFCRGRVFFSLEEDHHQYNDEVPIFWATGACLFIRKTTFEEHKGFDEDFFAHMEEIDLCWRINNSGKKVFYTGNSTVYHVGGGTLDPYNPRKTYLNFRNNLLMLLKNLPKGKVFSIIFIRLFLDGFAGVQFLFKNGFNHCWAIVRAHFSFYSLLFKFLNKRKPGIKNYYKTKAIVFQYFIKSRKNFPDLT